MGVLQELRDEFEGAFWLPGDEGYELARKAWNLAVDQRPLAVAVPYDVAELRRLVRAAADAGLPLTVQANGHGASGEATDAVLVRPAQFDDLAIDVAARTARVGAGVNWGAVLAELDGTGLVALAGSNPEVNAVAYTLGGGQSMFSRAYGLASTSLTAVELVNADGELRRITDADDPELMWALRGGGGLLGAVTAIEFALHPGDRLFGGSVLFPVAAGAAVLEAADELAAEHPALGIDVSFARYPDLPFLPEPLRGQTLAGLGIVHLGDAASGSAIAERVRGIGTTVLDGLTEFGIGQLAAVANEPTEPMPYVDWALPVGDIPAERRQAVVDAFVAAADLGVLRLGLRRLGGAINEPGDALLGGIRGTSIAGASVIGFAPGALENADAAFEPLRAVFGPLAVPQTVPTFLTGGQHLGDAVAADRVARLRAVKQRVDPEGVFRANRPLP